MPISKCKVRGLQEIHTLAGRVDLADQPYRAFMKITCLEMEKARREKEKESALLRVKNIDARLREIEAEKADLLKTLGVSGGDGRSSAGTRTGLSPAQEGFRLRY